MANPKYFIVKKDATETLVKTTSASLASAAVLAAAGAPTLASNDAIHAHFQTGGELHPRSIEEGKGKMWLVPTDAGTALIRAKNAPDALTLVHGDNMETKVATQDDLVRVLTARGKVIDLAPEPKAASAADRADESASVAESAEA